MKYEAWTAYTVRDRVIEAAETLIMLPAAMGPRMAGSMIEVFREYIDDYHRGEPVRLKRIPAPGALSRMEETWGWINAYLDERNRKLLYDYSFLKSRKGMFLARYIEQNGLVRRTFERQILRACQIIANNLNRLHRVRLTDGMDGVSQNGADIEPTTVSSVTYANWERAADAKPRHLPDHPDHRNLVDKLSRRAG